MLLRFAAGLVLLVLALVAVGGAAAAFGGPKLRGEKVDVGGRSLRLVCAGPAEAAGPLVWFESGAFGQAEDFAFLQDRLAAEGVRSCAYDRAGLGFSDPGPAPRDGEAVLRDRDALRAAKGVTGPVVLVAHSMAGLHARLWAARRPDEVVGLVLIDAAGPEAAAVPEAQVWINRFRQFAQVAAGLARFGLLKPVALVAGDQIGLPADAAALKRRAFGASGHNRWAAAEIAVSMDTGAQALAAGPLSPDLPVAAVTAGPVSPGRDGWKEMQAAPARRSRYGSAENVEAAAHASILGRDHGEVVVQAILRVAADARRLAAAPSPAVAP